MIHEIALNHTGKMGFDAKVSGHTLHLDTTAEHGGDDSGPGPKKLMLVSLAGCTAIDIISILDKKRVAYSEFQVKVEGSLTDEHPKIYDAVTINYIIRIAEKDRNKMQQAVELSSEKYCGVMEMFRGFASVDSVITFL